MTVRELNRDEIVHVRFDGRSAELSLAELRLRPGSDDQQIKRAVATYFERPSHYFDNYVVVRTSEATILRPEAIYG